MRSVLALLLVQSRAAVGVDDPFADKDEKAAALQQKMELQKAATVRRAFVFESTSAHRPHYAAVALSLLFQEAAPGAAEEFTDKEIEDAFRFVSLCCLMPAQAAYCAFGFHAGSSTSTRTCSSAQRSCDMC
jgi:hypothetical protein